jgi:hypothetical protein
MYCTLTVLYTFRCSVAQTIIETYGQLANRVLRNLIREGPRGRHEQSNGRTMGYSVKWAEHYRVTAISSVLVSNRAAMTSHLGFYSVMEEEAKASVFCDYLGY